MENFKRILNSFLASEKYTNTSINYDMNAIKIRLHQYHSDNRYIFFYIYHPWRICLRDEIINSSVDYPHKQEKESETEHKENFKIYCNKTKFLERTRIKKVKIDHKTNDLSIVWVNQSVLEAPTFSSKTYSYHIYDYINGVDYDVYYNRIEKDLFDISDRPK